MPTYTVRDPQTGKTLRLTGDSPPTEQELNQIFNVAQPKSFGGFAGNVVKSTGRLIGDTAGALVNVLNPDMEKNTVANLGRLGASIVSLIAPGEQGNEDMARNVGKFYADRYGGLDKAWNTLYNDPAGVAADLSVVLGGGATALKAGGLTKASNIASKASRLIDPLNITSKVRAVGKVTGKTPSLQNVFRKVGKGIETSGEGLATRGIGNPAQQADLASKYGRTVGEFIDQYDLWDRSPETANQVRRAIGGQYDDLALKSGKTTSTADVLRAINREIENLSGGASGYSDTNKAIIQELRRRRSQILEITGGQHQAGIDTITNYRKALDKDIPSSMFGLNPRGAGKAAGAKKTRDVLRSTINASDPSLERLGLDYGMAKGVEKIFGRSSSRAKNRQLISLSKMGTTGIGGMMAGLPGAMVGYATDAITTDPRFLKATSKTLKKVGGAVKEAKLPKVPKYANTAFKAAKVTRVLNPQGLSKQPKKSQTRQGVSVQKVALAPQKQTISRSGSYPSISNPKITPFKLKIKR